MRHANQSDQTYIAQSFVNIARFVKSQASDIYIDGLPDAIDEPTLALASSYINHEDAITLIVEHDNHPTACIAAKIECSSFKPSGIGKVGNIAICWVEPTYRNQHIGKALVDNVEIWLLNRGVNVVELSYLAQNSLAEMAWGNMGYKPFRVFSHKVLSE